MKIHAKLIIVCALASLWPYLALAGGINPCTQHQDKRSSSGREPEAHKLYQAACLANAGPWAAGFTKERFTYLGKLRDLSGHEYEIAFLTTIWGQSGRTTNRLLVFNKQGVYLGRYNDQFKMPTLRAPYALKFPNPEKQDNIVSFRHGIPSKIWIDGENYVFQKAN